MIIHYGEIALKGKNRKFFENKLVQNIKKALMTKNVFKKFGKIIFEPVGEESIKEILDNKLKKIPGIEYFAVAQKTGLNIEEIKKTAEELIKKRKEKTFTIKTKRTNKKFYLTSQEISRQTAIYLEQKTGKSGELKDGEIKIFIEIGEKEAYIYEEKTKGVGGLPVGTSDKTITLVSGGIDSPVAAYMIMKRGSEATLVHFYNDRIQKNTDKIEEITKQLTKVQLKTKLYLIPFSEIQQEIIKKIPSKNRMIIYRRQMIKIAVKIAQKEKINAIVMGDNLGQVASQTVPNLVSTYEASKIPVLTPLIGLNKEEIINLSKKIGTYEISIKKYADCCSYMLPQHPETRSEKSYVKKIEKKIDGLLIGKTLRRAEVKEFFV